MEILISDLKVIRKQIQDDPKRYVDDNLTEEYSDQQEFILHIRKILWNEDTEVGISFFQNTLILTVSLYIGGFIEEVDYKVYLNLAEKSGYLDNERKLHVMYLDEKDFPSDVTQALNVLLHKMTEYSIGVIDLHTVLKFLKKVEITDGVHKLKSKSESLSNRVQYINDIIENSTDEDLFELSKYASPNERTILINNAIRRQSSQVKGKNFNDLFGEHDKNEILKQFPISFNIYSDLLPKLTPREINMDEIEEIPPDFVRDWLPKFVYSEPEFEEKIKILFPGGRHIGHSAIIIKSNYGLMLLDFGMSVVNNSVPNWSPLLEKLDFILISHAHMDHSGSLPLFYGKDKKVPWFGQKATRIMTQMLWNDTRSIIKRSYNPEYLQNNPFLQRMTSKGSIINVLQNFNEINLNNTYKMLPNVEIEAYDAAHLFGSVGYRIKIGGKQILYTGDFNLDKGANFPSDVDFTIFDGTYYGKDSSNTKKKIGLEQILKTSKRVIIPAFSMGRSQEVLFKLKEFKAENDWRIYLTGMGGRLASKLNISVGRSGGGKKNGIIIKPTVKEHEFVDNTIVIAGQGMLQAGTSRNLFEVSFDDPTTSIIFCGYQAPNTMGFHLLNKNPYLLKKYKQRVFRISLSGHTSGKTLNNFLDSQSGVKMMVHSPKGAYETAVREDINRPDSLKAFSI